MTDREFRENPKNSPAIMALRDRIVSLQEQAWDTSRPMAERVALTEEIRTTRREMYEQLDPEGRYNPALAFALAGYYGDPNLNPLNPNATGYAPPSDAQGFMVDANGNRILDANGNPIRVAATSATQMTSNLGAVATTTTPAPGTSPAPGTTPWLGGEISEAGQAGTYLYGSPWQVTGPVTGAPGPVGSKGTVIPAGATLIRVRDPFGSDASHLFYLRYTLNGVDILYQIGDTQRFHQLFPGPAAENFNVEVMTPTEFQRHGYFNVGTIEEIAGKEESLASLYEREMLAATQGTGLAEWVRNDPEALFIFTLGTMEGWSNEQINSALARTTAFHNRFNGYNDFISSQYPKAGDADVASALATYVAWESELTGYLRYWRGPDTNTRHEYLGKLIGSGWNPGQIQQLLPIEANLKDHPEALSNLNEIMAFMGMNTVGIADFLRIALNNAPKPAVEALSDFALFQQLQAEGLGYGAPQVASMREGVTGDTIATRAQFSEMARGLAQAIISNRAELDVAKYGLNRDDLLAAALGRIDFISGGRSPGQVEDLLTKFLRERQVAAGGYEAWSSYIGANDRLQVQGLSGL